MTRIILFLLLLAPVILFGQDDAVSQIAAKLEDAFAGKQVAVSVGVSLDGNTSHKNQTYLKRILENRISDISDITIKNFPFKKTGEIISGNATHYRRLLKREQIDFFLNFLFSRHKNDFYITCQIVGAEADRDDLIVVNSGFSPELALMFKDSSQPDVSNQKKNYTLLARFPVSSRSLAISGYGDSSQKNDLLAVLSENEMFFYSLRTGNPVLRKRLELPELKLSEFATRASIGKLNRFNYDGENYGIYATSNLWSQSFQVTGNKYNTKTIPQSLIAPFRRDDQLAWLCGTYLPGENTWSESVRVSNTEGISYKLYSFEKLKGLTKISAENNVYVFQNIFNQVSLWEENSAIDSNDNHQNKAQAINDVKAIAYNRNSSENVIIVATSAVDQFELKREKESFGDYLVFLDRKGRNLNPYKVLIPTSLDIRDIAVYNPSVTSAKAIAVLGVNENKELKIEIYSWPESLIEEPQANGN